MQRAIALDMEGVLTPEIWEAVADRTGIAKLRLTTRDLPDYDELMALRLDCVGRHGLTLGCIRGIIADLEPLPGAREFLDRLRAQWPVVILSDTFEEFAGPLVERLGWPTVLCHRLAVDAASDAVIGWKMRIADAKRRAVESLQELNYHVTAVGDSFNDLDMLSAADARCLFRARPGFAAAHPELPAIEEFDALTQWVESVPTTGSDDGVAPARTPTQTV